MNLRDAPQQSLGDGDRGGLEIGSGGMSRVDVYWS